jgi:ATP-dependent Lon protease
MESGEFSRGKESIRAYGSMVMVGNFEVVLMPVSARKHLFDLSDDMATKVSVLFYSDAREEFIKAIAD